MSNNTLTPAQMNTILKEQFSDVVHLGFTADGIGKVFEKTGMNESSFIQAAKNISRNSNLIKDILKTCPSLNIANLERITTRKGHSCAEVIKKLHDHRGAICELTTQNRFSGTDMSNILEGSALGTLNSIRALVDNKEALIGMVERSNGFSANNIVAILYKSGSKLGNSIQALVSKHGQLLALIDKDKGFSASNISTMLNGTGSNLNESIDVLIRKKNELLTLRDIGFSASNIATMLNGNSTELGKRINALIQHQAEFRVLYQSGSTLRDIRIKLREYVKQLPEQTEHNPPVARVAQEVVVPPNTMRDTLLLDLVSFLWLETIDVEKDYLGSLLGALTTHRETLFQLHTFCGFSAHNIADILQGSRGNLDKAIHELGKLKTLLFGLVREGHFTADQLAEKLRGTGEQVGEVFLKDPAIRAALHASNQNAQAKPKAALPDVAWLDDVIFHETDESSINLNGGFNQLDEAFFEDAGMAPVADDFSLESNFFEKDDTDSSLLSFDSQEPLSAAPAAKRPRFA